MLYKKVNPLFIVSLLNRWEGCAIIHFEIQ